MQVLTWKNGAFVTNKQRIAFVTFASGRYVQYVDRFRNSIQRFCPEADIFVFDNTDSIGSPPHSVSPYSFKPHAINHVRALGYRYVVWCDSVVRLKNTIQDLLPKVSRVGVYLAEDGGQSGVWANDNSLSYFGIPRDEAMNIPTVYACIMLFDMQSPVAHAFLASWQKASDDGVFKGLWNNDMQTESRDPRCRGHRHDQTCAEMISYKLGIPKSQALLGRYSAGYFTTFNFP